MTEKYDIEDWLYRPKTISVYGQKYVEQKHTYKQRYWKKRKDGIKQRYWKKVSRKQKYKRNVRFDISGSGRDISEAVAKVIKEPLTPKEKHVKVEATDLIEHPEDYGGEEDWVIRPSVKSP